MKGVITPITPIEIIVQKLVFGVIPHEMIENEKIQM